MDYEGLDSWEEGAAISEGSNLVNRLREALDRLTPGQRRVAEYLLQTHPQAALFPAIKVAEGAGTSEATVVRLAMALGYAGYAELQHDARRDLGRTVHKLHAVTEQSDEEGWTLPAMVRQDLANIQAMAESVSQEQFNRAVAMLGGARRIHVTGARSSWFLAQYFGHIFTHLLGNVTILSPAVPQVIADLAAIGPGDLMVIFTFPRYTSVTVEMGRFAREQGAQLLCFTDSAACPLTPVADITLFAPIDAGRSWDSYTACHVLLNALTGSVMRQQHERVFRSLQRIEEAYARFPILQKS